MIFIKCFTTPISNVTQVNIARLNRDAKCYANVTKSSVARLATLIMTYQMLSQCEVTPDYNNVGWTAVWSSKND